MQCWLSTQPRQVCHSGMNPEQIAFLPIFVNFLSFQTCCTLFSNTAGRTHGQLWKLWNLAHCRAARFRHKACPAHFTDQINSPPMKRRKFLRNWPFKSQLTPADTQSVPGFAKIVTFQPKLTRRQDRGITCVVGAAVREQKTSETLWAFVKPSWWPISGPKVCISISPMNSFYFYKLALTILTKGKLVCLAVIGI